MQYLKKLGLAAIAATALMAFAGAGSASATELTCGTEMCQRDVTLNGSSEGKVVFDSLFGGVECEMNITARGETTGSTSETVSGSITNLEFLNCNFSKVTVLALGKYVIHTEVTGFMNNNGTLTSAGMRLLIEHFGVTCIFETANTDVGSLTGSATTKGNATIDLNAIIPHIGGTGGISCGESVAFTGSVKLSAPNPLNVD